RPIHARESPDPHAGEVRVRVEAASADNVPRAVVAVAGCAVITGLGAVVNVAAPPTRPWTCQGSSRSTAPDASRWTCRSARGTPSTRSARRIARWARAPRATLS
ncbi:MAG TPA: hypothetical protein VGN22_09810, partial [Pseudonocardia sp.]